MMITYLAENLTSLSFFPTFSALANQFVQLGSPESKKGGWTICALALILCCHSGAFGNASNSKFSSLNEDNQPGSFFSSADIPNSWITAATKGWMGHLSDETLLRNISIPGTHSSGSRYGGIGASNQTWTVTQQLEAGIRFLDIRCRPTKKAFAIYHKGFFQHQMFSDIMDDIVDFLNQNPTETIIIRLKEEPNAQKGTIGFAKIWENYVYRYQNHLFLASDSNPVLGAVRGKVFVMCDGSTGNCDGIGMTYGNGTEIQDLYKIYAPAHPKQSDNTSTTLPSKKEAIKKYMDKADTSSKWVINYLSGTYGMIAQDLAQVINLEAYQYIGKKSGKVQLGIIGMDYPGEKLVYRIIKSNFGL